MPYHTVVQGEYLSSIAKKYGFLSYKTIWDHAQNAALKQQRQNANVMFPGDKLFIPDKLTKQEVRSSGQTHHFVLKTDKLKICLVLEDPYGMPLDNAACELRVENEVFQLKADVNGKIEQSIPPGVSSALLTVKDPRTPINEIVIPTEIGHMDPVDEESGQEARLNNLGYFAGPLDGGKKASSDTKDNNSLDGTDSLDGTEGDARDATKGQEDRVLFVSAVEEFQCDHGLVVDGECGPATQAKLKQVHGC